VGRPPEISASTENKPLRAGDLKAKKRGGLDQQREQHQGEEKNEPNRGIAQARGPGESQ